MYCLCYSFVSKVQSCAILVIQWLVVQCSAGVGIALNSKSTARPYRRPLGPSSYHLSNQLDNTAWSSLRCCIGFTAVLTRAWKIGPRRLHDAGLASMKQNAKSMRWRCYRDRLVVSLLHLPACTVSQGVAVLIHSTVHVRFPRRNGTTSTAPSSLRKMSAITVSDFLNTILSFLWSVTR